MQREDDDFRHDVDDEVRDAEGEAEEDIDALDPDPWATPAHRDGNTRLFG